VGIPDAIFGSTIRLAGPFDRNGHL
jgi:hypothetical protein